MYRTLTAEVVLAAVTAFIEPHGGRGELSPFLSWMQQAVYDLRDSETGETIAALVEALEDARAAV